MDILNFYYIDLKYIRSLSRADDNVMSISPQLGKEKRPFLGIIILIDGKKYCIPLTSPKKKFQDMKSQVDFIKIFDHNNKHPEYSSKIIGILNLNNMIPVNDSVISKVNLKLNHHDTPDTTKRKILMQKQLSWCREHSDTIINRANKVYSLITYFPDKNRRLTSRCVNFNKLEQVLTQYSHT